MKTGFPLRRCAPLLLAVLMTLAPAFADARPGQGSSFGSRGSRTYSAAPGTSTAPYGGAPMQRSYTPNTGSSYGSAASNPGYGGGYGMRPRSAFTSGLLGGLLGAGIGGMLFGGGFFGGMHGGGGLLGLLLQLFLLYLLGSWIYRRFLAGNVAMAGGGMFGRMGQGLGQQQGARPAGVFGGGGRATRPVTLVPADYQAFDQVLHAIQAAWSKHDLAAMGTLTTPEMTSFFAEQMAEQTSRGVRNYVANVQLLQGDLSEAWSEGSREYATVAMRFSMLDVTKDGAGRVVDGSLTERVTVTEVWTFLRTPGGRWVLSAIQQAR